MAQRGAPNEHQWRPNSKHIAIHSSLCHAAIHNRPLNHPTTSPRPPTPARKHNHIYVTHIKSYKIAIEQPFSLKNINVSNFWEWPAMCASKFIGKRFTVYMLFNPCVPAALAVFTSKCNTDRRLSKIPGIYQAFYDCEWGSCMRAHTTPPGFIMILGI